MRSTKAIAAFKAIDGRSFATAYPARMIQSPGPPLISGPGIPHLFGGAHLREHPSGERSPLRYFDADRIGLPFHRLLR
jgi:hypothetical protein